MQSRIAISCTADYSWGRNRLERTILHWSLLGFPIPGQPNLDPALSSDIQVINGSVVGSNDYAKQGTHIGIRLTRTIAISREAQKDLIVIVNTREGGSGSLYLPVASFPDAKVCKIVYGTPLTKPGVQSEDLEVAFNSTKYDCADLGRKNGATDVRLGCDGSTGKRFADQQFCILGNACATPPGTQGGQGPFAPHPGCGW